MTKYKAKLKWAFRSRSRPKLDSNSQLFGVSIKLDDADESLLNPQRLIKYPSLSTPSRRESPSEVMPDPSTEQTLRDYWNQYDLRIGSGQLARFPSHTTLADLPIREDSHFRGFLIEGRSLYGSWGENWFSPPTKRGKGFVPWADSILCHVKPMSDPFVGVPDRWDLFVLLRWSIEKLGMRTANKTILISRTKEAWHTVEKLMQWEKDHPYRRSRLEQLYQKASTRTVDIKYAESAMRGIGLEWPGKPQDRRRRWVECVCALGLDVEVKQVSFQAKLMLKSDRSIDAQISRFLNQGIDMIQMGEDFHETLKKLGCTPRNIFNWLKRHRKDYPKSTIHL